MIDDEQPTETPTLAAGAFSRWLAGATAAIRDDRSSDVPCDGCSGCCTSSQFVLIRPDETDTLAHIPAELLFPVPGRPDHVLLGYDERGHCPMLHEGRCSIYAHRPSTCRTYDCRVFAATGFMVGDDKPDIAERVERWRFSWPSENDRVEHEAVRAAVAYLGERRGELEQVPLPMNPTQLAAIAIQVHPCFLSHDADGEMSVVADPPDHEVRLAVEEAKGALR